MTAQSTDSPENPVAESAIIGVLHSHSQRISCTFTDNSHFGRSRIAANAAAHGGATCFPAILLKA